MAGVVMNGPDVAMLHEHIKGLVKDGVTRVVIDLSRVRWFGSAMLSAMMASLWTLRNAGGDLRLTGVAGKVESIMQVTRLAGVFRTLESVDQAVTSFRPQPQMLQAVQA